MGNYWMLEVREPKGERRAIIGQQADLSTLTGGGLLNWLSGTKFEVAIPEPLEFQLDSQGGAFVTDFFPPAIPLMSVRMLDALNQAGVDNIDSYDAVITGLDGEPLTEEYKAVNIIGRIACADLDASICDVDDPDDPVGVDFESLVIDEDRTRGLLFFRLHEAVNGIVVHNSVKQSLEQLALKGIVFVDPEDWIG